MKTIVGLYNTVAEAKKVKSVLTSEGYNDDNIKIIDQTDATGADYGSTGTGYQTTNANHESIGARIKDFFTGKSGHDEHTHRSYTEGVANGGALLAVTVPDEQAERTADLLYQNGASDIEGGYGDNYNTGKTGAGAEDVATLQGNTGKGNTGYAGSTGNTDNRTTGEQVIPVVAEELEVGKRQVQRGGVRVYSHVVSEPVSESVSLHDERVVVDRRPVDRAATDADFNTGENVIEVTATGEEAVVGKRSRVVEEVRVGKEASDRTEEINDTVRHTEVDVENTAGDTNATGSGYNRR